MGVDGTVDGLFDCADDATSDGDDDGSAGSKNKDDATPDGDDDGTVDSKNKGLTCGSNDGLLDAMWIIFIYIVYKFLKFFK